MPDPARASVRTWLYRIAMNAAAGAARGAADAAAESSAQC